VEPRPTTGRERRAPGVEPRPTTVKTNPKDESHKPHRLRRLQTVWTSRDRPLFFVTFCTAERHRWLNTDGIHRSFVEFCIQSPERASVWIGKYVLMPDHIHVFVSAAGSQSLSRWVGSIKRHLAAVRRQGWNPGLQNVGHPYTGGGNREERRGWNPGLQNVGHPCTGGGKEKERRGWNPGLQQDCVGHPCTGGGKQRGKAWQAGFFDHALRGRESYSEKWEYVRLNPVRAGLVSKPEEWPYAGEIEKLRW